MKRLKAWRSLHVKKKREGEGRRRRRRRKITFPRVMPPVLPPRPRQSVSSVISWILSVPLSGKGGSVQPRATYTYAHE